MGVVESEETPHDTQERQEKIRSLVIVFWIPIIVAAHKVDVT